MGLEEVKKMVRVWFEMNKEEGLYEMDVEVFGGYVKRVVMVERDMEKVRGLVRWLGWLVEEEMEMEEGRKGWEEVVEGIRGFVGEGVKERGLGGLDIG